MLPADFGTAVRYLTNIMLSVTVSAIRGTGETGFKRLTVLGFKKVLCNIVMAFTAGIYKILPVYPRFRGVDC
jgi:hypothetical protein